VQELFQFSASVTAEDNTKKRTIFFSRNSSFLANSIYRVYYDTSFPNGGFSYSTIYASRVFDAKKVEHLATFPLGAKTYPIMSDDESDYERTLCQLPQVHVFKIPVRKSAGNIWSCRLVDNIQLNFFSLDGHRASDWPTDPTWTGKLKIVAKGRKAVIALVDENNKIFAACPVNDDSAVSRCFLNFLMVIRINLLTIRLRKY
jgi:hypothetical protein